MSLLGIFGIVVGAFFALIFGLQFVALRRSRKLVGHAVPPLPGEVGRQIGRSKHALLYFFSPGCAACKPLTPVVKELQRHNRSVFAVDVSRDLELARALSVMATPSTIELSDGNVVGFHIGQLPKQVLERFS